MRGKNSIIARAAISTALAVILAGSLCAPAVHAQAANSGSTWSLPEPTATPSTRAQGPVDPQNPVVRPRNSASEPAQNPPSAPIQTPPPTINIPAPQVRSPASQPARVQSERTQSPRVEPSTPPRVRPSAAAAPGAVAPEPRASATPVPQNTPSVPVAQDPNPAPSPQQAPSAGPTAAAQPLGPATKAGWPAWVWAIPAVLAVLGVLAFVLRRKRPAEEVEDWSEAPAVAAEPVAPPVPKAAAAVPSPDFAPPPAPAARADVSQPSASPAPDSPAPDGPTPDGLEIAVEPVGLRLSLVFATLQYRVTLTAAHDLPAGHLIGDMIGAHGSLTSEQQLAPSPETLTRLKPVPALTAGESITLTGEVQLPLSAIRPLQRANASFFVPLLRLCVVFAENAAAVRRVFTLGISGGISDGRALAPLRLDTGPMEHRELGAREVAEARAYPVLPDGQRRAAG